MLRFGKQTFDWLQKVTTILVRLKSFLAWPKCVMWAKSSPTTVQFFNPIVRNVWQSSCGKILEWDIIQIWALFTRQDQTRAGIWIWIHFEDEPELSCKKIVFFQATFRPNESVDLFEKVWLFEWRKSASITNDSGYKMNSSSQINSSDNL